MQNLRELWKILTGRELPSWWLLVLVSLICAGATISLVPLQIDAVARLITRIAADPSLTNILFALVLSVAFFAAFSSVVMLRAKRIKSSMIVVSGIMRYKDEIHIALRVATLKNLIFSLIKKISTNDGLEIMYTSGQTAGTDFISRFPTVFDEEISESADKRWANLAPRERIEQWTKYDKGGGWGEIKAIPHDGEYMVEVYHVSLFSGPVGRHIAHFMGGYVHAVLEKILGTKITVTQPVRVFGPEEAQIIIKFQT